MSGSGVRFRATWSAFVCGCTVLLGCLDPTFPDDEPTIVGHVIEIRNDAIVVEEPGGDCGYHMNRFRDADIWLRTPDGDLLEVSWKAVTVGASVRAWGMQFFNDSCPGRTRLRALELLTESSGHDEELP